MSSRRQFIGSGVAATAVTLGAAAESGSVGGSFGGPVRVELFVYETGKPLAIEAARVAAGQSVAVLPYEATTREDFRAELARLVDGRDGAVAGLTSMAGFDVAREFAALRGWSLSHSARAGTGADDAGDEALLHWIVGPGAIASI